MRDKIFLTIPLIGWLIFISYILDGCVAEHSDQVFNLEMKINQLNLKVQSLQERVGELEADKTLKKFSPKR